jgi:hypothetical protein
MNYEYVGRLASGVIVVVRDNGRFTDCLSTGEPVQYAVRRDERGLFLRTLHRDDWIAEPFIMDVNTRTGVGVKA